MTVSSFAQASCRFVGVSDKAVPPKVVDETQRRQMPLAELRLAKDAGFQEDGLCELVEAGSAECDASSVETQEIRVNDFAHVGSCVLGNRLCRQDRSQGLKALQGVGRTAHPDPCNLKVHRVTQPRIGNCEGGVLEEAPGHTLELFR
jgi:hypothetical protein